ncbi:MAG: hypothetical protein AB4042_16320 [Leptolyngbyaceae cyanobacterium]
MKITHVIGTTFVERFDMVYAQVLLATAVAASVAIALQDMITHGFGNWNSRCSLLR